MSLVAYFEVKSPKRAAKLRLDAAFFVIGRGERIPIFHDDPSISREHAAVVIKKSGVRIRDLGSRNGVLVNGHPIARYAEVDLRPGDSLRVGATVLVLREGEPPVAVAAPAKPHVTELVDIAVPPPPPPPARAKLSETVDDSTEKTGAKITLPEDAQVEDLSALEAREAPPALTSSDEDDAETLPQLE